MVVVVFTLAALAPVAAEAAAARGQELAVELLVLTVAGVEVEVAVWAGRESETGAGYTQMDDLLAAGGNVTGRYSAMPLPRRSRFHCPVSQYTLHQ